MRQPYVISIRGRTKEWDFDIWGDPKYVEEWRADGLQIHGPVVSSIPQWAQQLGLTKVWFWLQNRGVIGI